MIKEENIILENKVACVVLFNKRYEVWEKGFTHSILDSSFKGDGGLSLAKKRCSYLENKRKQR